MSQRYSPLTQITPENVKNLELQWVFQARSLEKFEATPLVVDGVMYTVQAPNDVVALDAVTGRVFWTYSYTPSRAVAPLLRPREPRRRDPRRHAVHGHDRRASDRDRREERPAALEHRGGRSRKPATRITHAPLVVKDKVIVGVGGRRVRHPRLHRGLRREDRQGSLALLHDSRPGRSRVTKPGRAIPGRPAARRSG